ncbi:hypothetical protein Bca52824_004459 [Brassica carinata]|uniref:Uncharacterized protein n=1 Tax=Brassica carinata TaxID=52824 RepID=A0A8X8BCC2_BRACI|nr:hypothetical protein Bca52824_004459 [Brassica carinata]
MKPRSLVSQSPTTLKLTTGCETLDECLRGGFLRLSNGNRRGERLRENTALPSALPLRPAPDFKRRTRRLSSLSPLRVPLPVSPSPPALAIVSPIEPEHLRGSQR